jgi:hypothetical protein
MSLNCDHDKPMCPWRTWAVAELSRLSTLEAEIFAVQLPAWSFQPDRDAAPGLYLACETHEQRRAIMRLLGAEQEQVETV